MYKRIKCGVCAKPSGRAICAECAQRMAEFAANYGLEQDHKGAAIRAIRVAVYAGRVANGLDIWTDAPLNGEGVDHVAG